jgi:hypothetical protein
VPDVSDSCTPFSFGLSIVAYGRAHSESVSWNANAGAPSLLSVEGPALVINPTAVTSCRNSEMVYQWRTHERSTTAGSGDKRSYLSTEACTRSASWRDSETTVKRHSTPPAPRAVRGTAS